MDTERKSLKQQIGLFIARAVGWQVILAQPLPERCVIVGAPHTSGLDLAVLFIFMLVLDVPIHWMAKSDIFPGPLGWLLMRLGGIPVNRRERTDMVKRMAGEFKGKQSFRLVICPEGTRQKAGHWKTGFYYIAREAGVPIVLGYPDWGRRVVGYQSMITPSGDIQADMRFIRDYYSHIRGRYANQQGEIKLYAPGLDAAE